MDTDTATLFRHILACTFIQARDKSGEIPVSGELIQDTLGEAVKGKEKLLDRKLITWTDFSIASHKSRRFIVNPDILRSFQALNPLNRNEESAFEKYQQLPKVNLFTGKAPKGIKSTTSINGNPVPPLVSKALLVFEECFYDRPALITHLKRMEETALFEFTDTNSLTAYYRLLNDRDCRDFIEQEGNTTPHNQAGIIRFTPVYKPQASGRISTRLQSATREMKYAMYHEVEGLNNYDLKSSQAVILLHYLKEAGIPCPWLETYLQSGDKQAYAYKVGLEGSSAVDCWKDCLYALFMGASSPNASHTPDKFNSLDEYLYNNLMDKSQFPQLVIRFNAELAPLKSALDKWHKYLLEVYPALPGRSKRSGKRCYVLNACGMPYHINPPKVSRNKIKRKLAAHMLQGLEACFIHHLTFLGHKYSYKPVANEHDGLIVIGIIPPEAVEEAKNLSGLKDGVILSLKNDFSEKSSLLLLDEDSEYMDIIV